MNWAAGVTTVPSRRCDQLPQTLESLRRGGFQGLRLFVDGCNDIREYEHFGMPVTLRDPSIGAWANWWLSMWELYFRSPTADRYAIFQDDIRCVRHLRQYLETTEYPERGYQNLILYPANHVWCTEAGKWYRTKGWKGRGGQGLVFSRDAVLDLLGKLNSDQLHKPTSHFPRSNLDGAVAATMRSCGWYETVHFPSLVMHTGYDSAIGNKRQPQAWGFPGEDFDPTSQKFADPS